MMMLGKVIPAALLSLLLAGSFWYERYQPLVACLAILAFVVLVKIGGWWHRNRGLTLIAAVDIVLLFLYLWSLDERVHVVIQVTPSGYVATIEGHVVAWNRHPLEGAVGFTAGGNDSYRTGLTVGGVSIVPPAFHSTSVAGRVMEWVRFAAPRPAWSNVSVTIPGRQPAFLPLGSHFDAPAGSWTVNRRGELEGMPGASALLPTTLGSRYVLQADLFRPDATQGILLSLTPSGRADALEVGFDGFKNDFVSPNVVWTTWNRGSVGQRGPASSAWFDTVGLLQHNLRLLLANIVVALLLVLITMPLTLALAVLELPERSDGGFARWKTRVDHPRFLDAIAVGMALSSVLATALFADRVLERLPHNIDSVAYLFQAKTFATGRLWLPVPAHPEFFPLPWSLLHDGKWFLKYPPGWPLTLAVGVLFGIPWLVNPILTGANVLLIYLVGVESYGRKLGLLAAVLAVSSPFLLVLGGEYMTHTGEIFFVMVSTYLIFRWRRRVDRASRSPYGEWRYLVPAGFALGMAAITRSFDAILFIWPFLLLLLGPPKHRSLWPLVWVAVGASAPVLFNLIYDGLLTGNPLVSPFSLFDPNDRPGFGIPRRLVGHYTVAEGLWNMAWRMESLLVELFGWPIYFTLALAVLPFVLGRATRWDALFGASATSVVLGYLVFWGKGQFYGPRYWAAAAPCIIFLTIRGFQELYRLGAQWRPDSGRNRRVRFAIPAALAVFLLACNVFVYLPAQLPTYRDYYYSSANYTDPLQNAHLHNALVFVVQHGMDQFHSGPQSSPFVLWLPLLLNSPSLNGDIVYAEDLGARDTLLIEQYPHRRYYRLDEAVLTRLIVKR